MSLVEVYGRDVNGHYMAKCGNNGRPIILLNAQPRIDLQIGSILLLVDNDLKKGSRADFFKGNYKAATKVEETAYRTAADDIDLVLYHREARRALAIGMWMDLEPVIDNPTLKLGEGTLGNRMFYFLMSASEGAIQKSLEKLSKKANRYSQGTYSSNDPKLDSMLEAVFTEEGSDERMRLEKLIKRIIQ